MLDRVNSLQNVTSKYISEISSKLQEYLKIFS